MQNHKSHRVCLFIFSCAFGLSLTMLSCVRFSLSEGTRLADATERPAFVAAESDGSEQKIAGYILERINLMIKEQAKFHPDPKNTYSTRELPVDGVARVLIVVLIPRASDQSAAIIAERKIKALGGTVRSAYINNLTYPIEIYCWLPYEAVKELAKLPEVSGISGIPIAETSNR